MNIVQMIEYGIGAKPDPHLSHLSHPATRGRNSDDRRAGMSRGTAWQPKKPRHSMVSSFWFWCFFFKGTKAAKARKQ